MLHAGDNDMLWGGVTASYTDYSQIIRFRAARGKDNGIRVWGI